MQADSPEIRDRDTYVVMATDYVVLRDLVETVRDFSPGAEIVASDRLDLVRELVSAVDRIAIAFLEAGPSRIARDGVEIAIRARGGRLVLLGDDAEDECEAMARAARAWPILRRPFSTRMVKALMMP